MPITVSISKQKNDRNFIAKQAENTISFVDDNVLGVDASTTMNLFVDLSANQVTDVYIPNNDLWCNDIRSMLTGNHMLCINGGWPVHRYGLQAITPRHVISAGHASFAIGSTVTYVNTDGSIFKTTISKWINDHPSINQGLVSDTKQPYVTDVSVHLLADELPSWVYKAPIYSMTSSERKLFVEQYNTPFINISQGSGALTPKNRMVYLFHNENLSPDAGARSSFVYYAQPGDSGTCQFIYMGGKLYLYALIVNLNNTSPILLYNYISYINSLITRADVSAGISTGYSLTVDTIDGVKSYYYNQ